MRYSQGPGVNAARLRDLISAARIPPEYEGRRVGGEIPATPWITFIMSAGAIVYTYIRGGERLEGLLRRAFCAPLRVAPSEAFLEVPSRGRQQRQEMGRATRRTETG